MSRVGKIHEILRFLQSGTPDVEGSALVSEDGLMIASVFPQHMDEGIVAGMTSTLLGLGERIAREMERGSLNQILVRGDQGYFTAMSASEGTVLAVLTRPEAKLGLIFLDMRRACEQIAEVL